MLNSLHNSFNFILIRYGFHDCMDKPLKCKNLPFKFLNGFARCMIFRHVVFSYFSVKVQSIPIFPSQWYMSFCLTAFESFPVKESGDRILSNSLTVGIHPLFEAVHP